MPRGRYRTIHVARLDRQMAEAEAIRRALATGARDAWVRSSQRITDVNGLHVWEVVLQVSRPPRTEPASHSLG